MKHTPVMNSLLAFIALIAIISHATTSEFPAACWASLCLMWIYALDRLEREFDRERLGEAERILESYSQGFNDGVIVSRHSSSSDN